MSKVLHTLRSNIGNFEQYRAFWPLVSPAGELHFLMIEVIWVVSRD
jgi:hypothetical protein